MSGTPFMQLYVGDYLSDTLDLTTEQHGAYLLLLMTMWSKGAKLPSDQVKLARIARMTPAKFRGAWAEISRFFDDDGEHITNRRMAKDWEKTQQKIKKRASAGSAGGTAKALKEKEARLANAMRSPCHSSEPEPESYKKEDTNVSLSLIPDHQPIDNVAEAVLSYKAAAQRRGWPIPQQIDQSRRKAISARMRDAGGLEGWNVAIEKAEASEFLGSSKPFSGFGIDWIAKPANFRKIMEGNYDGNTTARTGNREAAKSDALRRQIAFAARARPASSEDLF